MNRKAIEYGKLDVPYRFYDIAWSEKWTDADLEKLRTIADSPHKRPVIELTGTEIARFKQHRVNSLCAGDCRDRFFEGRENVESTV